MASERSSGDEPGQVEVGAPVGGGPWDAGGLEHLPHQTVALGAQGVHHPGRLSALAVGPATLHLQLGHPPAQIHLTPGGGGEARRATGRPRREASRRYPEPLRLRLEVDDLRVRPEERLCPSVAQSSDPVLRQSRSAGSVQGDPSWPGFCPPPGPHSRGHARQGSPRVGEAAHFDEVVTRRGGEAAARSPPAHPCRATFRPGARRGRNRVDLGEGDGGVRHLRPETGRPRRPPRWPGRSGCPDMRLSCRSSFPICS